MKNTSAGYVSMLLAGLRILTPMVVCDDHGACANADARPKHLAWMDE